MNKRGNLFTDIILFMFIAFFLVVFAGVMIFVSSTTYTAVLNESDVIQNAVGDGHNATTIITGTLGAVNLAYGTLHWTVVAIIFSMVISILITSFLVRTNPVFFIPYLFILIIDVIVSVPISNTYEIMYSNPVIASGFTGLTGASWIILYLPVWVTVVGLLAGVLMFINVVRADVGY